MRKKTNILTTLTACLISCIGAQSYGQNFVPPAAYSFDYNSAALQSPDNVNHTANYSIANIPTGFGAADMYLGGWSSLGTGSEVTYQFTVPGNPTGMFYQGIIPIPNGTEVTVGSVRVNTLDYILIAYRLIGAASGYKLDLYRINISTTTPISFSGSFTLSTSSGGDGRISMDCHKQYGVALVYPTTAGIETRVANTSGGTWAISPAVTLTGTAGNTSPDVAFNHSNSGLNVHYVYYNPSTYRLTESVLDFYAILGNLSGSMTPAVEDVNQLPVSPYNFFRLVRPVIDCPDHYDVDNWAYAYTYTLAPNTVGPNGFLKTEGIFVRHVDYHSSGVPATVNVTDGSLGNAPCMDYYPIYPTLCYGEEMSGFNTGQIYVSWYNQENPTQDGGMFVGVHMRENGGGLLSVPDYLTIPNSLNSYSVNSIHATNLYDYYISPIALSKNSDAISALAPDFLYTTYLYRDVPFPYPYLFNHVFHKWNDNTAYKGSAPSLSALFPEYGSLSDLKQLETGMQVQPNPFNNAARASFTLTEDGTLRLQLSDIVGRVVWQREETAIKGAHTAQLDNLQKVPAGVYMLKASLNGKPVDTKKIIKQ